MSRVSTFLSDALYALPIGCVAALVWANTSPESYYPFARALAFFVNDIGIAFFLGLVMKEVVEATLPGGTLHPWRRAALPLAAAVGGAVVPVAIFFLFLHQVGDIMLTPAWMTTCAVDIAGIYVAGRLIFGRHAGLAFLLVLALGIDAVGLTALAVWNPIHDVHLGLGLVLMPLAIGAAVALRWTGFRNFWWYLAGPGVLSWWALYLSGLHPALALIPIVPFMPHASRDKGLFVDAVPQMHDTLTNFERWWQLPVQGILLLFGLVNAGVPLHGLEEGTWAVPVAVLIGRPIGVLAAAGLAVAAGLHLPQHLHWPDVAVIGCITSIGLVMALFFAAAAMPTGPLLQELTTGGLMTAAGALVALGGARVLHVGRFSR
jgi:NhaA family Na+:H+ antiporter